MLLDLLGAKKLEDSHRYKRIINFVSLIAPRVWMITGDTPLFDPLMGTSCCMHINKSSRMRSSHSFSGSELM